MEHSVAHAPAVEPFVDAAAVSQSFWRRLFHPLPRWIWVLAVGLAGLGAFSANPILTPVSIVIVPILISLLWSEGEPPVLLFACAIQWLQVTTVLHYANFAGANLVSAFGGDQLQSAVGLGLFGLLALSFGARVGLGRRNVEVADQADREALQCSIPTAFILYLASFVIISLLRVVAVRIPQLAQILSATGTIKWVFLFIVCLGVLQRRSHYLFLWTAVAVEFLTGFLGYFSGFKNVFFLLIVVMLGSRHLWNAKRVLLAAVVCVVLVTASIVWSAIKQDYRDFLSQGSKSKEVVVPVPARLDKLQDLVGSLTDEGFFQGVDALIARVGYVTYFALAIGNVPDQMPYEKGQLWIGAVKHVVMPRLFFPNKAPIDDSERTSYYTGVTVAGVEQGTSISMGYMAESYIDLGPVGMFIPIFLLGLFYGFTYRLFVVRTRFKLFGFAAVTSILLFAAYNFETSNVKLLGGIIMSVIVTGGFLLVAEPILARLLGLQEQASSQGLATENQPPSA